MMAPLDTVIHGDCLDALRTLPAASVDAVVTDPPYFRVKGERWDRQWDNAEAFLRWLGQVANEWARVLKPNGSLYVFASPQMAARVEVRLSERFHVLNSLVWHKDAGYKGWSKQAHKEGLRSFFPQTERIIFAEHYGADSMALGESGYAAQCERARGFVFEPLRAYLEGERKRAGITFEQVRGAVGCRPGSGLPSHWFTKSQWALPTAPHYAALQRLFNERGRRPAPPFADFHPAGSPYARLHERAQLVEYLRADYEDLRADYEDLRADYEDLRRPFTVTADVPYTDVWDFATVAYHPGKHPCEKPLDLMRHILRVSVRPGGVVLDPFAGSGSTLVAAQAEGMRYIGIEREAEYVAIARARLASAAPHRKTQVVARALPTPITPRRRVASVALLPSLWDEEEVG
jgi:site-specific DNA-methyltransferase (adenine-specific)